MPATANVSRGQLIGQFNMLADSVNHRYLQPEQEVGRALYQSIAERLLHLPQVQVGSPFPPASFVEQEAAMLNRQPTSGTPLHISLLLPYAVTPSPSVHSGVGWGIGHRWSLTP